MNKWSLIMLKMMSLDYTKNDCKDNSNDRLCRKWHKGWEDVIENDIKVSIKNNVKDDALRLCQNDEKNAVNDIKDYIMNDRKYITKDNIMSNHKFDNIFRCTYINYKNDYLVLSKQIILLQHK